MAVKIIFIILALILCIKFITSQNSKSVKNIDFKTILSLLNAGEPMTQEEEHSAQLDEDEENEAEEEGSGELQITSVLDAFQPKKLLRPQIEVLRLVESFLRLKGQMASRVHALIYDNFDIFKSLYKVLVYKLSSLHGFSLQGVRIIRRIIEFALNLIGQWNVNVPFKTGL